MTDVSQVDDVTHDVTVASDEIAAFTWLEAVDVAGRFSDNGFLMTEREVTVQFLAVVAVTEEELAEAIQVTSLISTYTKK